MYIMKQYIIKHTFIKIHVYHETIYIKHTFIKIHVYHETIYN